LFAWLERSKEDEVQPVLGAWYKDDLGRLDVPPQLSGCEARDRLTDLHDPARGRVVRVAGVHRGDRRFGDVVRRREVRLSDLEVYDVLASGLQTPCSGQDFKGAFGPKPLHPLSKANPHPLSELRAGRRRRPRSSAP